MTWTEGLQAFFTSTGGLLTLASGALLTALGGC